VVFVIGPKLKRKTTTQVDLLQTIFSLDDLSRYDGKEGRPAYVAFKSNIYDVSGSKLWKEGVHVMRHYAGTDLTDLIGQAPHNEDKILGMPVVGRLVVDKALQDKKADTPARVFYSMAYMNLVNVLLISLILALWRW